MRLRRLNGASPPNNNQQNIEKPKFSNLRLFRTSLLYQTREFFNNSTLHGVRYIAETGRPFGERYLRVNLHIRLLNMCSASCFHGRNTLKFFDEIC